MVNILELKNKILSNGKIVGYLFVDRYNKNVIIKKENLAKYISKVVKGSITKDGYLRIAGVAMGSIPSKNINKISKGEQDKGLIKSKPVITIIQKGHTVNKTSGLGNQPKRFINNKWYKDDYMGYEGLAEWAASEILKCSDLPRETYTTYSMVNMRDGPGCVSANFALDGEEVITFARIFKMYQLDIDDVPDNRAGTVKDRITHMIEVIHEHTKVDVTDYMRRAFTLDALIYNPDRHINNLALILKPDGTWWECPLYDNGLGLLSDTRRYPMDGNYKEQLKELRYGPYQTEIGEHIRLFGLGFKIDGKKLSQFLTTNEDKLGRVYHIIIQGIKDNPNILK